MCRALDGLMWTLPDYGPKGHSHPFPGASAHWNCRSVAIPATKSWEELAKEAGGDSEFAKRLDGIPKGEGASLGGPVDAGTAYQEWAAGDYPNKPMTVGELQSKMGLMPFHADKKKFAGWFDKPVGNFVIGGLPPKIQKLLGTKAESLIYSKATVLKQIDHHPGVLAETYIKALERIKDCSEIYPSTDFHIALYS